MAKSELIGKKLSGRYEVTELLGRGGMSSVYAGNDPNLRRKVAIKVIHPHLSEDPQFISRFEEEAAAVAQLKHPNIIQVFDFNHDDETYYMVLEYVPGVTLQEHLEKIVGDGGTMGTAEAREIVAKVCDALEYAHQRGMIHRDIKPANIMITDAGQVILIDFGVAKMIGGKQHTATGAVVGTALYVSPEQVRGKEPDHRVDLYALGVTMFEMLSGKPPFEADSAMTTMMMHVNEPVPDIRELNPDVPDSLKDVIEKALAKERDDRYKSAADMAKALRSANLEAVADQGKTTVEPMLAPVPGGDIRGTVIEQPVVKEQGPATVRDVSPPPVPPAGPPAKQPATGGRPGGLIAGGVAGIAVIGCLVLAVAGYFLYTQFGGALGAATETPAPTDAPEPTATVEVIIAEQTDTPEPTLTPSPSPPPEPFVLITDIRLNGSTYLVDYETFGYTEMLPGQHVHFFYDTVPPSQAGSPGSGPWAVWGGPRPFDGYHTGNRPAAASQLCALVANPNHSIIMGTGNCFNLPG
jgi:predicted Ser/Thr protein kinase